jgi:hypothetical protein
MKTRMSSIFYDSLLIMCSLIVFLFSELNMISKTVEFVMLNIFLAVYVLVNLKISIKKISHNSILTLTGIFIFFQYLVQINIGNFSLLHSSSLYYNQDLYYLNKSMYIAIVSCLGIMIGFRNSSAILYGEKLKNKFISNGYEYYTSHFKSIIFFILSVFVYIFAVRLGILGYADTSNLSGYIRYASISQYIIYVADMGMLVVLLLFVDLLKKKSIITWLLFILFLSIRIMLAILSGMKIELLGLLLGLIVLYMIIRGKIPRLMVALFSLSIIFIYRLSDIFRAMLRSTMNYHSRVDLLLVSYRGLEKNDQSLFETFFSFLNRLNIIEPSAAIVHYKDTIGLSGNDPSFMVDLLLIPITTFIPRALLPGKPMSTYGLWVTHTVYGLPKTIHSSSYVTVQGFFYLAGGIFCVFIGFLSIGLFLNFCSGIISLKEKNLLLVCVFIIIITKVLIEPSTPIGIFTGVIRGIVIYVLLGRLLINKKNVTGKLSHER